MAELTNSHLCTMEFVNMSSTQLSLNKIMIKSAKKKALKVEAIQCLSNSSIKLVFHFNSKVKIANGSLVRKERTSINSEVDSVASRIKTIHQRSQLVGIRASVVESNNMVASASTEQPALGATLKLSIMACRGKVAMDSKTGVELANLHFAKGSTAVLWLTTAQHKHKESLMSKKTARELLLFQLWCSFMLHSGELANSNLSIAASTTDLEHTLVNSSQTFMLLGGTIYGKECTASEVLKILTDYRLSCAVNNGLCSTEQQSIDLARVLKPENLVAEYSKTLTTNSCPTIYSELSVCMLASPLAFVFFCLFAVLRAMQMSLMVLALNKLAQEKERGSVQ